MNEVFEVLPFLLLLGAMLRFGFGKSVESASVPVGAQVGRAKGARVLSKAGKLV